VDRAHRKERSLAFFLLFLIVFSFQISVESLASPTISVARTKSLNTRHSVLPAASTDNSRSSPMSIFANDLVEKEVASSSPHIVFPGGGIFFYYQAGLVSFLRESGYDLSNCTFAGASAGALTATLTATDVDFYEATDLALKMAAKAGVWDRSAGLQGIWGPMIEDWLDTLLPPSIDPIQGRVTLLVTPVPSFGKTKISEFNDRTDLIKCNMASVHLVSHWMRSSYPNASILHAHHFTH
jgi:hypothetical protein